MIQVALVNLYSETTDSVQYMDGRVFLSAPVLRQFRVQRVACETHSLLYTAPYWQSYSKTLEETASFGEGWQSDEESHLGAWSYSSAYNYPKVSGILESEF